MTFACRLRRRSVPLGLGRSLDRRCVLVRRSGLAIFPALRQDQLDVRDAPLVAVSAALRRRTDALQARPVVGDRTLHVEVVNLDVEIFLGAEKIRVVQRRLQQLAHVRRHALLGERQGVARFFHAPSLDQFQHQPRLLGRDSQVPHFRSKFHISF